MSSKMSISFIHFEPINRTPTPSLATLRAFPVGDEREPRASPYPHAKPYHNRAYGEGTDCAHVAAHVGDAAVPELEVQGGRDDDLVAEENRRVYQDDLPLAQHLDTSQILIHDNNRL